MIIETETFDVQTPLSIALSQTGRLYLYSDKENQEYLPLTIADKIRSFFKISSSIGLLRLGLMDFSISLPTSLSFWRQFAQLFIAEACKNSVEPSNNAIAMPSAEIVALIRQAPCMRGIDYLNLETPETIWQNLCVALAEELKAFDGQLEVYLSTFNAAWNTIGRVCFHLAENKNNPKYPFAFLATYATRLSKNTKVQHIPLGRALEEYSGNQKKSQLLALLIPVQKAAEKSIFLKTLIDDGSIFKALSWSPHDAHQFLKDIPFFETAGVIVRVPNWWDPKKPPRPKISVSVGDENASAIGLDALLDFNMCVALPDGKTLTSQELKHLLSSTAQLIQIKGQWVQVDSGKLSQVLSHWEIIQRQVKQEGLSFAEGLRLLSGIQDNHSKDLSVEDVSAWSTVIEGKWLNETLEHLRHPDLGGEKKSEAILNKHLKATLRPYQQQGVQWLWWLYNMRLGGCLADDMGLGKTIQMIALLLLVKYNTHQASAPHLLILPTSLLGNWQTEINRFAPDLRIWIAHSSASLLDNRKSEDSPNLSQVDLVITTYGTLYRLPWMSKISWNMVILDEAQAIKNPTTKQARAIKSLHNRLRFILTGTPIENRLLDLWSLFDFVAPGLLGSSRSFADYSKQKSKQEKSDRSQGQFYASVRQLVSPYILRRLKSDKRIINDLPDKTEIQTYCTLTKQQVVLYQQAVNELKAKLEEPLEGVKRRGLVLSYLIRFKQICNHPNQWLGHGSYDSEASGKFIRIKELCEVIAGKQEKVLIFTQFREIIPALSEYLTSLFGQEGLFLHGQTPVRERVKHVEAFQKEEGPPFFVLSLKAGGTGLNLTAASHVIHFDRWWNPAVENQATDRAYRIGQKRNVLVHKFICRGTIEEKIDSLMTSKKTLAEEIISGGNDVVLTELSDAELLKVVTLDIHRALGEN
jgi:superfamily II DNA or RNA helicase